jgi:hypothetical protein
MVRLVGCAFVAMSMTAMAAAGQDAAPKPAPKAAHAAKPSSSALSDALMAREKAIIAAVLANDKAAFQKELLPDALMVDENGYMTLADFMGVFEKMKGESATPSDMKVIVVNPGTALVTYKLDQKGSFDGHPWPALVYATTMWVNHGGAWHAAFHQESTAASH